MSPVSAKTDEPNDLPCNSNERRRMLYRARRCLESTTSIPVGGVVFWTKPIAEIPSGFAMMDGSANSAGSGINMVDHFFKCEDETHTVGEAHRAEVIYGGEHSHTGVASEEWPMGRATMESSNIEEVSRSGGHTHTVDIYSRHLRSLPTVDHPHLLQYVSQELVVIDSKGDSHDHATASLALVAIADHTAPDVAACFEDHDAHTHNVKLGEVVQQVASGNPTVSSSTGSHGPYGHTATGPLTHDDHGHSLTVPAATWSHMHSNQPVHSHVGALDPDGSHSHAVLEHGHEVHPSPTIEGAHNHPIVDPTHTHSSVDTVGHQHEISMESGSHTHEAGDPVHVKLIPIERIS